MVAVISGLGFRKLLGDRSGWAGDGDGIGAALVVGGGEDVNAAARALRWLYVAE